MIPFIIKIPKEKMDRKIPGKLSMEISGILNWAIEVCLKWQSKGLEEPKSIKVATNSYKEEIDIIEPFILDMCFLNQLAKIEARELYATYSRWCEDEGSVTPFKLV